MTRAAETSDDASALPTGTVTFLLTDVEGSTRLWDAAPGAMAEAIAAHYEILSEVVARHGGARPEEQGEGDSVVAAFSRGSDAVAAALEAQRVLQTQTWPGGLDLSVRVALHTAEAELRDEGNDFGVALSRCARLRAIAGGGQTVLSRATHDLVIDQLPEGAGLVDLGVQRLRDLGRPEHVYALAHPDLSAALDRLPSLDGHPNNLPDQLTSFVGRDRELEELRGALADARLLTLTGAGGSGKTRMALHVAADELAAFAGGVWWVELAALAEPEFVGEALGAAVGVRPLPGMTALQAVCGYLGPRRVLVVLDNCEHLLAACAQAAEALLQAGPDVTVLATSRAPLGVPGEIDWRLPPMSLPSRRVEQRPLEALERSDAGRLFVERAGKVRSSFVVSDDNAPAIARVCRELDGIPLALELAAARVRMLSVEQIAASLGDRFRLLTGGARSALPRQKTLRGSVDWSHALLGEDERRLFRRLAVFAGGFTVDEAEVVCAGHGLDADALLDLLGSLVDGSLLLVEERGPAVRFRFLETVREYARGRLEESGEADEVRDRHLDACLALAERAAPDLETSRQVDWLDVLDAEASNFAAALERATSTAPEHALALCVALTFWWRTRARFAEAEVACGRALEAAAPEPSQLRARVLWGRAYLAFQAGEFEASLQHARAALDVALAVDDRSTAARALYALANVELYANPAAGRPSFEEARELAGAAQDDWALIECTHVLAMSSLFQADHLACVRELDDLADLTVGIGCAEQVVRHWLCHGTPWYLDGRLEEAREALKRARAAAAVVDEPLVAAVVESGLAFIDVACGDAAGALERLLPTLEEAIATGAGLVVPAVLLVIGQAELALGRLEEARGRLGALVELTDGRDAFIAAWSLERLAHCQRLLGDDGAVSTARRAIAVSQGIGNRYIAGLAALSLGRIAAASDDWTMAEQHAHAGLDALVDGDHRLFVADALDALAEVAAGLASHAEAARLLAAADRARSDMGSVRLCPEEDHWNVLAASLRAALGDEAYEQARGQGAELSTDEAVAWVRRARGRRKRPPGGWESLTPTELQVVRLAAQGLTNPQIGERMFISRGTVKVHLSHVYAKLGIKNRSELAAEATRRQEPEVLERR